jgi:catechol 2,3-dioxygenase-like lactoylglutathione lyase family enzyme
MKSLLPLLALAVCGLPALAQLPAPNAAGVSMGHLHLNVKDVDANLAFFGTLGGKPIKVGGRLDGVKFPDVFILLRKGTPSGPSEGSVINHVGLKVNNLKESLARWEAKGIKSIPGTNAKQAFIVSPDELRIEITEDSAMSGTVANHHIHFYTASVTETQAWYVKTFGVKAGKRAIFEAADAPGVNLTFSAATSPLVPIKGRVLDHIGFEVKDLEAFCKKLEASGVKFDVPFRKVPDLGLSIAFFTDPFGVYIELTEGLNKL